MNTAISLCVTLLSLLAVSECIPVYASPRLSFGGGSHGGGSSSGGFEGGSSGYGGSSGGFGGSSSGFSSSSGGGYGGSSGDLGEGSEDHQEQHHHEHHHEDYHHEPKPYAFGYAVKDFKKGTNFNQHETSDGHYVKGGYEVALPDGRLQIVKYNADWKNGFNADVKYHGESHHPEIYATHEESGLDHKSLH